MSEAPPRTGEVAPRSLFDRDTFATLVRAMHPRWRSTAVGGRVKVGDLDRQPDATTAWVYGAYVALLGRLPDTGGLQHHDSMLRRGGTPDELITGLATSHEALARMVEAPADPNHVFITGAYLVALGRLPDEAGLQGYADDLRAGADHEQVLRSLLQSGEAGPLLRFPPASPSHEEMLAGSVQQSVMGSVDPEVQAMLIAGRRSGRPVTWMIWATLRGRHAGRRAILATMPRALWLAHRSRRQAVTRWPIAALDSSTEWNWRVQRKLLDDVAQLSREIADLRDAIRRS